MENFDFYRQKNLKSDTTTDNKADYVMHPRLERAVNVAVFLRQPLLLTGEPGTGKTALAYHLAQHFDYDLKVFYTKTASLAKDLFYGYDALKHYQWVQNHEGELSYDDVEQKFIQYRALGEIIKETLKNPDKRFVLLIDEIDKAPRDFPNDLLNEIENMEMEVPEIERVGAKAFRLDNTNLRPLIIITSNTEKNLPEPFLRRVVYYHINFPDETELLRILKQKLAPDMFTDKQWEQLVAFFLKKRGQVDRKAPATAELIAWVKMLHASQLPIELLDKPDSLNNDQRELLKASFCILAKDKDNLQSLVGG